MSTHPWGRFWEWLLGEKSNWNPGGYVKPLEVDSWVRGYRKGRQDACLEILGKLDVEFWNAEGVAIAHDARVSPRFLDGLEAAQKIVRHVMNRMTFPSWRDGK